MSCVKQNMAMTMAVNQMKLTSRPTGTALLYFITSARTVPRAPPRRGPTYGMMFSMPVRKAIPMAALNPSLAIRSSPRKLTSATPVISMSTPVKYLVRRCPMSERAFTAVDSYLSGTTAATIFPKRLPSLMKKKLMNPTENIPMPRLVTMDAADPMTDENTDTSRNFFSSLKTTSSILKSGPRLVNVFLRNSLRSARGIDMFLAVFSMLLSDMPFTIPLTTGTIRVTMTKKRMSMMQRVKTARSQSGAFLPLILIFWSPSITGWDINDNTTARSM